MGNQKDPRQEDKIQVHQLLWTCVVAITLGVVAFINWSSPKSALLQELPQNPNRAPAGLKSDSLIQR